MDCQYLSEVRPAVVVVVVVLEECLYALWAPTRLVASRSSLLVSFLFLFVVSAASSPSRGGDVAVCVFDVNQPSLPTPFYSVLMYVSVFMALSTVFHSIILPRTLRFLSLFFRSYFCPNGPFNCVSLYESLPQP